MIGLSILSGAHNTLCMQLMELLRAKKMTDVTVVVGGIIPGTGYCGAQERGDRGNVFAGNTDAGDCGVYTWARGGEW